MSNKIATDYLVWIDMEMSGLNPENNVVLEIATVITDSSLNVVATGPELVIGQPPSLFETMDDWNQNHHSDSGLWHKVQQSTTTVEQAEHLTLTFIEKFVSRSTSPLCGNSIAQDRLFLRKYMPTLNDYLHYRMIDVSSLKELVSRWYQPLIKPPTKENNHRALADILESIDELRFYKSNYFRQLPREEK